MHVTFTGIYGEQRRLGKQILKLLCIPYSGALCIDGNEGFTTTHVVSDPCMLASLLSTSAPSDKLRTAVEAGLPIISFQWIRDCRAVGRFLPPESYQMPIPTATTLRNIAASDLTQGSLAIVNHHQQQHHQHQHFHQEVEVEVEKLRKGDEFGVGVKYHNGMFVADSNYDDDDGGEKKKENDDGAYLSPQWDLDSPGGGGDAFYSVHEEQEGEQEQEEKGVGGSDGWETGNHGLETRNTNKKEEEEEENPHPPRPPPPPPQLAMLTTQEYTHTTQPQRSSLIRIAPIGSYAVPLFTSLTPGPHMSPHPTRRPTLMRRIFEHHGDDATSSVTFFDSITVDKGRGRNKKTMKFVAGEYSHGAKMLYDIEPTDSGGRQIFAFSLIESIYRMGGDEDASTAMLWMEHRYCFTADDFDRRPAWGRAVGGRRVDDDEVLVSANVYHSPCNLIMGEFGVRYDGGNGGEREDGVVVVQCRWGFDVVKMAVKKVQSVLGL